MNEKYDFSGWATRNDILCADKRTIRRNAFKDDNGKTVPLVWMHQHDSVDNVLGHALLENRPEGVFVYGSFNDSPEGQSAKERVKHGDIRSLSIYANHLKQTPADANGRRDVIHGSIKEVSLVLAGANEGATIENTLLEHADGWTELDDEAEIRFNQAIDLEAGEVDLSHADEEKEEEEASDEGQPAEPSKESKKEEEEKKVAESTNEKTVKDVFDSLTEEQKQVVYYLVGKAAEGGAPESEDTDTEEDNEQMKHNVFESDYEDQDNVLTHDDMVAIAKDAKRLGSYRDAVLAHADDYGIKDIDFLFPDAKTLTDTPEFIQRENAWVSKVINGTKHSPFSRVKSMFADITADEARAKGYIKGKLKKNEVFSLLKRTTDPQTIYKKQKMDRDDVLDITDFDVITWLKGEMRIMLDEEIARAILVGDGRLSSDDDKISEDHIRPVATDSDLYTIKKAITGTTAEEVANALVDEVVVAMDDYKGSGTPKGFIRQDVYTRCKLLKDSQGYRLYKSDAELANAMMLSELVPVPKEIMGDYYLIALNLNDYNVGADKGGAVSMFDDFDIDYNQQKYLIETRCSGALVKPYSALAFGKTASSTASDTE